MTKTDFENILKEKLKTFQFQKLTGDLIEKIKSKTQALLLESLADKALAEGLEVIVSVDTPDCAIHIKIKKVQCYSCGRDDEALNIFTVNEQYEMNFADSGLTAGDSIKLCKSCIEIFNEFGEVKNDK